MQVVSRRATSALARSAFRSTPTATRTFSSTALLRIEKSDPRAIEASEVREIQRSERSEDVQDPSHASIDEGVKIVFPDIRERDRGVTGDRDYGHSTIGPGVGKHTRRTLGSLSMQGKVCVVTGAARGLGNLFARTFAESGSNAVVILDLHASEAETAARDLEQWFVDHGEADQGEIRAVGIGCDVSSEADVKRAFGEIKNKFGRIDALVTAAGIVENFKATEYPTEKLRKLFGINVEGAFFCAREAASDMIARNEPGSIVLVGSMSGAVVNVPQPQTPYNASKAAVRQMAASLAVEWAKQKIRVNCLSPGYMATSLTRTILDRNPDLRETWENLTPMGRVGEPEDLKGAIVYLASDASVFTTGIELRVDGGYTLT